MMVLKALMEAHEAGMVDRLPDPLRSTADLFQRGLYSSAQTKMLRRRGDDQL